MTTEGHTLNLQVKKVIEIRLKSKYVLLINDTTQVIKDKIREGLSFMGGEKGRATVLTDQSWEKRGLV